MFKTRLLGHRIHSPRKSDNGRLSPVLVKVTLITKLFPGLKCLPTHFPSPPH